MAFIVFLLSTPRGLMSLYQPISAPTFLHCAIEQRKLVGLISQRSLVQIRLAQPNEVLVLLKPIKIDLPDHEEVEIHIFADEHLGTGKSNMAYLLERIEHVAKTENAYCVLGGDLMDMAIASSIGDIYSQEMSPMQQLKECTGIFAPVASKVLCALNGNHERRQYKTNGIDMTYLMCKQLGIEDKYTPDTGLIFIRFGKDGRRGHHNRRICYTMYLTHGSGGGKKEGGKFQRLADLACIADADIYVHNHTHLPGAFRRKYFRVDSANSSVSLVEKLFVNSAGNLEYGGYADTGGFTPASLKSPVIYLQGRTKKAEALV